MSDITVGQLDTETLLLYSRKISTELKGRSLMSTIFEARFNRNKKVLILTITNDSSPHCEATVKSVDNGMYLLMIGSTLKIPNNAGLYHTMDEAVESCLNITGW